LACIQGDGPCSRPLTSCRKMVEPSRQTTCTRVGGIFFTGTPCSKRAERRRFYCCHPGQAAKLRRAGTHGAHQLRCDGAWVPALAALGRDDRLGRSRIIQCIPSIPSLTRRVRAHKPARCVPFCRSRCSAG
jgi:hypothetical protein